jgi:DNA-directed RNA polymerase subunit F
MAIGKKTLSEKPVSVSEVKKILEDRKERGELTYEQKVTLEYAQEFGDTGPRKLKEAIDSLKDLGLDEKMSVRVIDVRPKTKDELKLIFEKTRLGLKDEQVKKILDIAAELE